MNEIIEAEVVEGLNKHEARLLTMRIRELADSVEESLSTLVELITEARDGGAPKALEYRSWTEYVKKEFGHTPLQLDRDDRRELVVRLRDMGMSTRAIAPVVGRDRKTVERDIRSGGTDVPPVTGIDGKTYTTPKSKGTKQPTARCRHCAIHCP